MTDRKQDIVERLDVYAPFSIPDWVNLSQSGVKAGDIRDASAEITYLRALVNEWLCFRSRETPEGIEALTREYLDSIDAILADAPPCPSAPGSVE